MIIPHGDDPDRHLVWSCAALGLLGRLLRPAQALPGRRRAGVPIADGAAAHAAGGIATRAAASPAGIATHAAASTAARAAASTRALGRLSSGSALVLSSCRPGRSSAHALWGPRSTHARGTLTPISGTLGRSRGHSTASKGSRGYSSRRRGRGSCGALGMRGHLGGMCALRRPQDLGCAVGVDKVAMLGLRRQ